MWVYLRAVLKSMCATQRAAIVRRMPHALGFGSAAELFRAAKLVETEDSKLASGSKWHQVKDEVHARRSTLTTPGPCSSLAR
jgi:hypothetical protein